MCRSEIESQGSSEVADELVAIIMSTGEDDERYVKISLTIR